MARFEHQGTLAAHESQKCCDYFCQPCNKNGSHLEAEGFCKDCREFLCKECYRIHKIPTPLQQHELVDKVNMKLYNPPTAALDIILDKCQTHWNNRLEYVCSFHDTLSCSMCITSEHRNCDIVHFIPNISADIADSLEYKELNKTCASTIEKAHQIVNIAQKNKMDTDDIYDTAMQNLKKLREDINIAFDNLLKEITEKAARIQSADKARIDSILEKSSETAHAIQTFLSELKSLQDDGKHSKLFVRIKKAKTYVNVLQASLHELEPENNITEYRFIPKQQFLDHLETPERIGVLFQGSKSGTSHWTDRRIGKHQELREPDKDAFSSRNVGARNQDHSTYDQEQPKARYVTDINVKSHTDLKYCMITGIVTVGDKLIITDANNINVKVVDIRNMEIFSELKVSSIPWALTRVDQDQLAVTLPNDKKIVFLRLTDSLAIDRELKVSDKCYGIAQYNKNLVLTFINPPKVEFIDTEGNFLYTFDTMSKGRHLFSEPVCVAAGPDDQVYVSDEKSNTVTSVAVDGIIKFVYTNDDLRNPTHLVVDTRGLIFICGNGSNNIHVINSELKKTGILLCQSDGLKRPHSMCYCQRTGRLFIRMLNENTIKVYQLFKD